MLKKILFTVICFSFLSSSIGFAMYCPETFKKGIEDPNKEWGEVIPSKNETAPFNQSIFTMGTIYCHYEMEGGMLGGKFTVRLPCCSKEASCNWKPLRTGQGCDCVGTVEDCEFIKVN